VIFRGQPGGAATLSALAVCAALSLSLSACNKKEMASPAQCEKLLERFIDLKMSEAPGASAMTSEERAALRGKIANDVNSDSDVQQVKNQCVTEVTAGEYTCAIAAPTSKAWNDCIE
jgi:hypothetical protein